MNNATKILIGALLFPFITNAYTLTQDEISDLQQEYSKQLTLNKYYDTFSSNQTVKKVEHIPEKTNYWETVHSVESKQGAMLYRPRNRSKSCSRTSGPCGHHQLTVQALKDIGCVSKQCKKDRENYSKSLLMSKKLLRLNEQRLSVKGLNNLPDYQKYLIHQQGAAGLKAIVTASEGKHSLSRKIRRNMANNSPYSFRSLTKMGSKQAANTFMHFWEKKWEKERALVSLDHIPLNEKTTFNNYKSQYAQNMRSKGHTSTN